MLCYIESRRSSQGRGILYGADGSRFSGTFVRGQLHGHGQQTERDGSSFAGMFKAGSRSGTGVQTMARGDVFCGTYVCGARQGQGSYVFSTNNARLNAFYEADIPRRAAANGQPRIKASRAVVPQDTAKVAQSEQLIFGLCCTHQDALKTLVACVQVWAVYGTRRRWKFGFAAPCARGERGVFACHAGRAGMRMTCSAQASLLK